MNISLQENDMFVFEDDLSGWAKTFLNGRQAVIEIAGPIKLLSNEGPIIYDLDTTSEEASSKDSLELFWSRKGK